MKDNIYTIPISEVFEPRKGCPICALHRTLESRWVEYITGAAMMEPDVRQETNRQGFCSRHFPMLLEQRNRLSVALMLQTRLAYLDEHLEDRPKPGGGLFGARRGEEIPTESCFVCERIDGEFRRIAGNIATVWAREQDFRTLYAQQECLCHPHYRVLAGASGGLRRDQGAEFLRVTAQLARKELRRAKGDIDAFCGLFDYRSAAAGTPSPEVSAAVETAIAFLIGGKREE